VRACVCAIRLTIAHPSLSCCQPWVYVYNVKLRDFAVICVSVSSPQ